MAESFFYFTLAELAKLLGTPLVGGPQDDSSITSIEIDSRNIVPGALFIALRGERTDGHRYLSQAAQSGAVAALVEKGRLSEGEQYPGMALLEVPDPLLSLGQLAKNWIDRFPHLVRIAVSGSSGKTSCKELLGSVLSEADSCIVNAGNLNSEIGLPLALFTVRKEHRYGVFELGINRKGEMDLLSSIYRPRYVLISNIGEAHSGPLGGRDGVFWEKSRIFTRMEAGDPAFLPEGEKRIGQLEKEFSEVDFVVYGPDSDPDIGDVQDLGMNGWAFLYKGREMRLHLLGRHNLMNASGVAKLASRLGLSPEQIARGFERAQAVEGRSRYIPGTISLIDDCYNANLDSSKSLFEYLSSLEWNGRKIIVFGSMKELGKQCEADHRKAAEAIVKAKPDAVFLYGDETFYTYDEIRKAAPDFTCRQYGDDQYSHMEQELLALLKADDLLLLKGSRSMQLERIAKAVHGLEGVAHV